MEADQSDSDSSPSDIARFEHERHVLKSLSARHESLLGANRWLSPEHNVLAAAPAELADAAADLQYTLAELDSINEAAQYLCQHNGQPFQGLDSTSLREAVVNSKQQADAIGVALAASTGLLRQTASAPVLSSF
eukprot:TRINITY_DN18704_c0_g1_i1.p3 TRINITY_DN18704_c0_g1~~TRINITY_DN18704_c0_g1_i1.p3  ORF type:complete len:156 (-),score=29.58 TRINITY_DN18704_c0_g1_i1:1607-2008(-)